MEEYSLADGQKIWQKKLNEDNSEEKFIFVGNQVFSQRVDSTYQSLNLSDLSTINLYTDKGRVIRLNKSFDLVDELNPEGLWVNYLRKSGYSFLAKGDKTLILNSENHKVAEVTASGKSTLLGGKLYTVQENSFIETDLSKVLIE